MAAPALLAPTNGGRQTSRTRSESITSDDGSKLRMEEAPSERRSSQASTGSQSGRRASTLNARRRSSFRGLTQSINFMKRMSRSHALKEEISQTKLHLKYENTYQMEPSHDKFSCSKVKVAVDRILNTYLRDETYDEKRCRNLVTDITSVVKSAVKELNFDRYKIVCSMILGESKGQGIEAVGRCCWDPKTDSYVTIHYDNGSLFSVFTVHGVYFE